MNITVLCVFHAGDDKIVGRVAGSLVLLEHVVAQPVMF